jgi:hypothetical protein
MGSPDAYIAPMGMQGAVAELERMAPSWLAGAHGAAMLQAWVLPHVQSWLTDNPAHFARLEGAPDGAAAESNYP